MDRAAHFYKMSEPRSFLYQQKRAGDGIRVGLQNLLNDNSEEAKLLGFQLEMLNNHLAAY